LFFARRKPASNWSALNKKRVEKLLAANLMQPAGLEMIELAKKTGTWVALDKVEALEYPNDLMRAFIKIKKLKKNLTTFPKV
jgi:uncharacterized protein YdeI (YjbR/CyaY-like superfamily)